MRSWRLVPEVTLFYSIYNFSKHNLVYWSSVQAEGQGPWASCLLIFLYKNLFTDIHKDDYIARQNLRERHVYLASSLIFFYIFLFFYFFILFFFWGGGLHNV